MGLAVVKVLPTLQLLEDISGESQNSLFAPQPEPSARQQSAISTKKLMADS